MRVGVDEEQRRPGGRFGRHQVFELPAISVIVTEHRTHQLRCRQCRARAAYQHDHHDSQRLQAEIASVQAELQELREPASPEEPPQPLAPAACQQPAQDRARALDVHHHRGDRADPLSRGSTRSRSGGCLMRFLGSHERFGALAMITRI
jgi:hypothetical protein